MAFYQGQQVRVIWTPAGLEPIVISDARADGDSVDAAWDDPERIKATAFYGRLVKSTATNRAGSVTVTLQAVSRTAQRLRQILRQQELAIDAGGIIPEGPLVIQAPDGTRELVTLGSASLSTAPNVTLGNEAPSRAFTWRGIMNMDVTGLADA